ncbi:MAG: 30S ribosomal protein S20 (Modular protein) [Candidatus Woesebacteria bacterium GW2011_GWB1_38_5]|uniref:30S ribosomal protein S20 (Modular protein) n=4 Tax=Candidatus Woeseibacteriota TaxID=1752722 RepID=A0A0G0L8V1_9BACT|nr:MAG: 30S ribosomal protein S20 (Modular protein) [Candidatus Woesebacteria bacterium GW2011_GWD1_38_10]KKQ55892.1 MAG: 30S ribosomal protein S20 (Modular protein) [Candidatus Woesebacteria bacterium GW2011_GWC1_38_13]KKQ74446.1 MAG: 30S ribosomal protein S20 (Modular protein) [Candidatus Woesebacteria bacterium GW2011_GWB1_38_5]KKQ84280.1 MAG: 30S ribosomal protein S20 (Modular protein) [Candidatus Woesebacteria bacterium GW2011_GWA1_38_8]
MPVTKTAKRALRGSKRKAVNNKLMSARLEIAIRMAKKSKKEKDVVSAISLTDRSAKIHVIHKNKAARIKSALSKLLPKSASKTVTKKTSKKAKVAKSSKK